LAFYTAKSNPEAMLLLDLTGHAAELDSQIRYGEDYQQNEIDQEGAQLVKGFRMKKSKEISSLAVFSAKVGRILNYLSSGVSLPVDLSI